MKATLSNILAVHLAILCATVIVVFPLLLGRYVVRRYSAFLVALVEIRADVCAGIWGGGLRSFSERLEADPTVRTTTLRDLPDIEALDDAGLLSRKSETVALLNYLEFSIFRWI